MLIGSFLLIFMLGYCLLRNLGCFFFGQQGEEKTVTIDEYVDVESYSEEALMAAVAKQPVSVAIEASAWDFQLYSEV